MLLGTPPRSARSLSFPYLRAHCLHHLPAMFPEDFPQRWSLMHTCHHAALWALLLVLS